MAASSKVSIQGREINITYAEHHPALSEPTMMSPSEECNNPAWPPGTVRLEGEANPHITLDLSPSIC